MAAAGGLALLLPRSAHAHPVAGREVAVPTPDGTADGFFVAPTRGKHPAVLMWPDIVGLRPAFREMATRLAAAGYAVLVPNPYYRWAKAPILVEGESFAEPPGRTKLIGLAEQITRETTQTDARAFGAFFDGERRVDRTRRMGTTGYCMSGRMTIETAAALPERIGAAASFHGGGLATTEPDSPHLLIAQTKARYLFAVAQNDDANDPEEKVRLAQAFEGTGLSRELEVYPARHGWCALDSRAYDEVQAERAWTRLLALLEAAL